MREIVHEPALTEQVRNAIVGAIVDGTFKAGDRLGQIEIATRLGVSRQPVSHALKLLQDQGIVIQLGRKGLTVAPMDPEHLLNLYQVRGTMDALAARLAALRVAGGTVSSTDLRPLEKLVFEQLDPANNVTFAERVEADVTFHVSIYRLSGNKVIEDVTRPHWVHFRRSIQTVLGHAESNPSIWEQHRQILAAIGNGDAVLASELALKHTSISAEIAAARLRANALKEIST
jgi:DNA-binding GntR family transcriptional regulator